MSDRCGFTGCPNAAALRCAKCGLPLCGEHAAECAAEGDSIIYCQRCAAYLKARKLDGPAAATGGGRGD